MIRRTLLSVCLLSLVACATPVSERVDADQVDAAVKQNLGADFHGVVLVGAAGSSRPVVRAYGQANIGAQQATTVTTSYQIGSISKWLTAVAVLRLVDQRKLSLDAPVRTYLPQLPAHTGAISLRQLLSNSAGIPNGVVEASKKDNTILALPLTHAEAVQRFATGKLLFEPGAGWEYSPTTWVVVAAIVERATGQPYATAIDELVLKPANATGTAVPLRRFDSMPGAALAYKNSAGTGPRELNQPPHVSYVAASGTIYSHAADLARLAHTIFDTELLSPRGRADLVRVMVPSQNYALGGRVKQLPLGGRERSVAWETGAIAGYKTLLAYVPGDGNTLVILNNTGIDQAVLDTAAQAMLKALY